MQPWREEWKDYFEILGVKEEDPPAAVKRAYWRAALRWHPDRVGAGEEGRRRFLLVSEAYAVLSDQALRGAYLRACREREKLGAEGRAALGPCVQKGCGRPAAGGCFRCGRTLCGLHLTFVRPIWPDAPEPRPYCWRCAGACSACGAPLDGPTPPRLSKAAAPPAEPLCAACFEEVALFPCAGCGKGGHFLKNLGTCPTCGTEGLCPACLPRGETKPCRSCNRRRRLGWSVATGEAAGLGAYVLAVGGLTGQAYGLYLDWAVGLFYGGKVGWAGQVALGAAVLAGQAALFERLCRAVLAPYERQLMFLDWKRTSRRNLYL
jgi:hypothetical protein